MKAEGRGQRAEGKETKASGRWQKERKKF